MIITFCGTQSVGKSTLLSALQKDERYKEWMFEPEITRSLKEKFGLNINESGDSITQLFVLNSHLENVVKHKNNNGLELELSSTPMEQGIKVKLKMENSMDWEE
jgi:deoxyadenosine/deoxycytidine kinase